MRKIHRAKLDLKSDDYSDPFWGLLVCSKGWHIVNWESVSQNVERPVAEVIYTVIRTCIKGGAYADNT